jgi:4-hydroxybenzoate polyprenyltransferase
MVTLIRKWASFVKISHTVFALPFALASMAVAARKDHGWPGWRLFTLILGSMVAARTCAMAFNRIVDRKFDALNPRTSNRHLVTGELSMPQAILLCASSALMLPGIAWFINPLCFALSPLAVVFVCFYSLTKRFTDFTHVWLGFALALAPLGAWIAVRGHLDFFDYGTSESILAGLRGGGLVPVTLAVSVVLWLIGFDLIYATQDYEFDRRHGLHSMVVRWGPKNALGIAFISHIFMWAGLVIFGLLNGFRFAYWLGLALILGLLVAEHLLARKRDVRWINVAFFKLNAVISCVFLAVVVIEVVFPWFRLRWY